MIRILLVMLMTCSLANSKLRKLLCKFIFSSINSLISLQLTAKVIRRCSRSAEVSERFQNISQFTIYLCRLLHATSVYILFSHTRLLFFVPYIGHQSVHLRIRWTNSHESGQRWLWRWSHQLDNSEHRTALHRRDQDASHWAESHIQESICEWTEPICVEEHEVDYDAINIELKTVVYFFLWLSIVDWLMLFYSYVLVLMCLTKPSTLIWSFRTCNSRAIIRLRWSCCWKYQEMGD